MKYQNEYDRYTRNRVAHWDSVAHSRKERVRNNYYQRKLQNYYSFQIPKGRRILEIGCGTGELLASLQPSYGLGVDFSDAMIQIAARRYPELTFKTCDALKLDIDDKFDFIVLSDLVNDIYDVQMLLHHLVRFVDSSTRIIMNFYSRLWEIPLLAAKKIGIANPLLQQNWLTVSDLRGLLKLASFEPVKITSEILVPIHVPFIEPICNKILVKMPLIKHLAITNCIVARNTCKKSSDQDNPLVSVIIAARNEEGHIRDIFERTKSLEFRHELVFVEGGSSDNTFAEIQRCMHEYPQQSCQLYKQRGKGKGDAVRVGFEKAKGEILMILDADLTVPPEDLERFYDAIISGKGEFINGVRLVYPMEDEAMRPINFLGNKFFSMAFSWLLNQPIKDTLCGTKVLWKSDYEIIQKNRSYFGDFDPFGDFDLLFGAAKLNLKILDVPIRYRKREYGETNIQRWRHGLLLLRMVIFAVRKVKFV